MYDRFGVGQVVFHEVFADCVFNTPSVPRCSMKSLGLLKSFRPFSDFHDHYDRKNLRIATVIQEGNVCLTVLLALYHRKQSSWFFADVDPALVVGVLGSGVDFGWFDWVWEWGQAYGIKLQPIERFGSWCLVRDWIQDSDV